MGGRKKEIYIISSIFVYIIHSLFYEYVGSAKSLEWIASYYIMDYMIVAFAVFLIPTKSKICRFSLNTIGIFKVLCSVFIMVSYFWSSTVLEFWYNVDNVAPFYVTILMSGLLSILSEWIKIKK